ncbi:MAG: hypothetical protein HKN09_08720 [Saprospiraceae bacterium]|nr:hypothetical protein [Saprospiraceae bacterium]
MKKLVGPQFSFLERFKMKGIGTQKMIISDASDNIFSLIINYTDTPYCNIELRKNGIVVGFSSNMRIYCWAIPYYKLVIVQQGSELMISTSDTFVTMQPSFNSIIDKSFIVKMLEQKQAAAGDFN